MTSDAESLAPAHGRWRAFPLAFVALLVPMLLWSLASPLMSVPDEAEHAIRAVAVAHGDWTGHYDPENPQVTGVTVPRYAAEARELQCMANRPGEPASCQKPVSGDAPTASTTTAGSNGPLFYAVVGLPSLFLSGDAAFYGMRFVSAILCAGLLALAFVLLRQLPRSRWATLAGTVAVTPMVLFLSGSMNPNGVEVAAAAALFAALAVTFRDASPGALIWERAAIVVVSAALLTNTRTISLLWVLLALGAALLVSRREVLAGLMRRPPTWIVLGVAAVVCVAALAWYLKPSFTTAGPPYGGSGALPITAFATMILGTVDYGAGWVGYFGWLDRPAPGVTYAIWALAIGGLAVAGLIYTRGRARLAVLLLALAVVLVPAFSQAAIISQMGYIWQGRYTLALVVVFLLACGVALDARHPDALATPAGRRGARALIPILAFGQVAAFVWVLVRYVIGTAAPWPDMLRDPSWQPPGGWILLTVLLVLALAGGSWLALAAVTGRAAGGEPSPGSRGPHEATERAGQA